MSVMPPRSASACRLAQLSFREDGLPQERIRLRLGVCWQRLCVCGRIVAQQAMDYTAETVPPPEVEGDDVTWADSLLQEKRIR